MDSQNAQDASSQEKMAKLEAILDAHQALIQKTQTASLRPSLDQSQALSPQKDGPKEAFLQYLRKGLDPQDLLTKSIHAFEGTEGGFLVPQDVSDHIHSLLKEGFLFSENCPRHHHLS